MTLIPYGNQGLSAQLYRPIISVDTASTPYGITYDLPGATWIDPFGMSVSRLSFVSKAVGGFDSARLTMEGRAAALDHWLEYGLPMHVEIVDQAQVVRWEGYVETIRVVYGGLTWQWGPVSAVGNRVAVLYNVEDTTTIPPTSGERTITDWAEDEGSQGRYGARIAILNSSDLTDVEADQYRDMWLLENAAPARTATVRLGGQPAAFTVELGCKGYWHQLSYPYNQTTNTGTQDLSVKLEAILDEDPNGIVSSANADVATNALQVNEYEGDYRKAQDLVKALLKLGDGNYDRYLFMIERDRHVRYETIPELAEYRVSLTRGGLWQVQGISGTPVRPWEVEAGKWAILTDVAVAAATPLDVAAFQDDLHYVFIEQVTYTAPDGLQIQAGQASSVEAALAQWGLGEA